MGVVFAFTEFLSPVLLGCSFSLMSLDFQWIEVVSFVSYWWKSVFAQLDSRKIVAAMEEDHRAVMWLCFAVCVHVSMSLNVCVGLHCR